MLEKFISPVAAQRLRSHFPGVDLDAFCGRLTDLGYRRSTLEHKLWIISNLTHWMAVEQLAGADLDEGCVEAFVEARRRNGRTCRGFRLTALQLLEQLRSAGVVPMPDLVIDDSPTAMLLARYEKYLRQERALVESTITAYMPFVHALITEHLAGDATRVALLRPDDVRVFLLDRVRRMVPRQAQYMATALRSFLRFLFLRGLTETNLALTVPTVRQWRLSSVPRHLPEQDVERLLRSCDCSSSTGRRNHAILLLLARLGLRASEVINLELSDLHWREGEIVVRGKGLVRDRLPLVPDVGAAIAL